MSRENPNTYELHGEMLTIAEIVKFSGLPKGRIASRLRAGWSVEDAISKPVRPKGVNAAFSKGDVDLDISKKSAKDKADFSEFAGFAQCRGRTNAK